MPHPTRIPTPTNPSASGTTYLASTTIHASALTIWRALLDFPSYPHWNTFTPRCEFPSTPALPKVGEIGELDAVVGPKGGPGRLTKVLVTLVEGPAPPAPPSDEHGEVHRQDREPAANPGTEPPEGEEEAGTRYRICWSGQGFPTWSLRPERVHEIEVLGGGDCAFRTWETMAGPLSGVVKRAVGSALDESFKRFVQDLKAWVEGGCGEKGDEERGGVRDFRGAVLGDVGGGKGSAL